MDGQTLNLLRDDLHGRLTEILPGVKRGISSIVDIPCHQGPMDEADITAERHERELLLKMHRRTEEKIWEIREALKRMRTGNFGTCEECGRDIELQRLKAQPMAKYCLECKRELELRERRKVR